MLNVKFIALGDNYTLSNSVEILHFLKETRFDFLLNL